MNEILLFIVKYCAYLYYDHGFRFVDSCVEESFGNAWLLMESDWLTLRFIRDKGQLFLDFERTEDRGELSWNSIDIIRQLITGEKTYHPFLNKDNADFLYKYIQDIKLSFNPDNYPETIRKINKLKLKRSKIIFN